MTELLIVYHSRTGAAHQMAQAAADGAQDEGAVTLLRAEAAGPEDLLHAAGFLFCAPENLASLSGLMKEFFDRCYYPLLGRIEGRAYAQMIAAGTDGEGAARQVARIAAGWRLREAQPPLILRNGAQTPEQIQAAKSVPEEDLKHCRALGAALAAGLTLGVF